MKILEKIFTFLGITNFLIFVGFLLFGDHGGWFIVNFPYAVGEWLLFYCPILYTTICSFGFMVEYYRKKIKNWYWFFILILSYLPIVIWVLASIHLPAH